MYKTNVPTVLKKKVEKSQRSEAGVVWYAWRILTLACARARSPNASSLRVDARRVAITKIMHAHMQFGQRGTLAVRQGQASDDSSSRRRHNKTGKEEGKKKKAPKIIKILFIEFSTMHKTTDNKRKQNANVVLLDIVLALDYGRVRDTGSWY